MTERNNTIVTDRHSVTESNAPEPDDNEAQRRAYREGPLGRGVARAVANYGERLRSSKAKDRRWAEDEREKASLKDRAKATRKTRTPRAGKPPLERAEQKALVRWLKDHGIHYNANLEGVHRHFRARVAARHAGMQRGRPDIEILSEPTGHGLWLMGTRGVAIELKRQKPYASVLTREQAERLERYRRDGWLVRVCYGADEAVRWLESLGYGR